VYTDFYRIEEEGEREKKKRFNDLGVVLVCLFFITNM
jgi:hypothetical protein